jgi:hypothetical protein
MGQYNRLSFLTLPAESLAAAVTRPARQVFVLPIHPLPHCPINVNEPVLYLRGNEEWGAK